jgi:mevalonate kinase
MKAAQAAAWNDEVVDVAEELLNNQHYKKLQSEIDSEIKDLEFSKNGQSESKIRQIDEQIKKLKEFKNKINRSTVQEVETLEGLYTNLIKFGKWKWFFENIDALTKLVTEESEALHRALNNFDGPELRRVIKELQGNNKSVGITDESINNLISFMGEVKIKRVLKSWEDLVSALKTFLKFAWKLT